MRRHALHNDEKIEIEVSTSRDARYYSLVHDTDGICVCTPDDLLNPAGIITNILFVIITTMNELK